MSAPLPRPRESSEALKAVARDLGFVRVGVAAAGPSPHRQRYQEWLDAGRHGTMTYMARDVARRIDPRQTLAGARSVVVCALPYPDQVPFPADNEPGRGKIARYARGRDYHKVMVPRLISPQKKDAVLMSRASQSLVAPTSVRFSSASPSVFKARISRRPPPP